MSFDTLMNISVTVQKVTRTKSRRGGVTETWSTRFSSMPVRVQPISGKEQLLYNSERTPVTHNMFVPGEYTGILESDRITYGSRTFEIQLVRDIDFMAHHYEVVLRELKQAV